MRTASNLLALVVVLGFVSEAGADPYLEDVADFSLKIGQQRYGFIDTSTTYYDGRISMRTTVFWGPLGTCKVPFTATQGLVGFCLILATLIILPAVLTVRWKKKRSG